MLLLLTMGIFTKKPDYAEKLSILGAKIDSIDKAIQMHILSMDMASLEVKISDGVWNHLSRKERDNWLLSFEIYFQFKLTDRYNEARTIQVFSKETAKPLASMTKGIIKYHG